MTRVKSFFSPLLLSLIATPIGNIKEMSPRAIETLMECDVIACEDTRVARKLCSLLNVSLKDKQLLSLREHNEQEMSEVVISFIKERKKVVYMSDAGYPTISDPGEILVQKCIDQGIAICVINSSSALLSALIGSNLSHEHFLFYGFLSPKGNERKKELMSLIEIKYPIIFYEAPHRIEQTLFSLYEMLGERKITLARELTKMNEEYIYGTTKELLALDLTTIKGEIVLVVEGQINKMPQINEDEIIEMIKEMIKKGMNKNEVMKKMMNEYNLKKNYLYNLIKNL